MRGGRSVTSGRCRSVQAGRSLSVRAGGGPSVPASSQNAAAPREAPHGSPPLPGAPPQPRPTREAEEVGAVPGLPQGLHQPPALRALPGAVHALQHDQRPAPRRHYRAGPALPLPPRPPIPASPARHEYALPAANGRCAGRAYGMRPRACSCGPGGRRRAAREPQDGDCHVPGALPGQ